MLLASNHPLAALEPLLPHPVSASTSDAVTFTGERRSVTFLLIPGSRILKCTEYDLYGNDLSQKIFRMDQLPRAAAWGVAVLTGSSPTQNPLS